MINSVVIKNELCDCASVYYTKSMRHGTNPTVQRFRKKYTLKKQNLLDFYSGVMLILENCPRLSKQIKLFSFD